jgi:ribonuclease VapC
VIVIDSSAALSILFDEKEATRLVDALSAADAISMSAANVLESTLRLAPTPAIDESGKLDAMIALYGIDVRPIDLAQLSIARAAFLRFGKGRHPARLNFGDCFAYALAKSLDAPLLFVGDDFAKTDIGTA